MRVLKFGGTSTCKSGTFFPERQKLIDQAHLEEKQAAGVLSAPAEITNHLVALYLKKLR